MPVETLPELATIALESSPIFEDAEIANTAYGVAAAALAVGLSAIGAGYAEAKIGSAAVGATAEDEDMFGRGLLLTVIPETMVIFAIVVFILVLFV